MSTKKITILTGAGLSNMIGLPMTNEFKTVMKDEKYFNICQLLEEYLQEDFNDIEKVMSILEDSLDKNNKIFQKFILEKGKIFNGNMVITQNSQSKVSDAVVKQYKVFHDKAGEYLSYLKENIYDKLKQPNTDIAKVLYENVLLQLKSIFTESTITIFTTNYDLSFEEFWENNDILAEKINTNKIVDYGFQTENSVSVFNPIMSDDKKDILKYYKLHGSLDWLYTKNYKCTKSGTSTKPTDPDAMPILYPGFKGRPQKEPFIKLHDMFFDNLQKTDVLIVIGFAFRDPYINELITFSKSINTKYKMLYFNPTTLDELPKESGLHEFKQYFGNDLIYANEKIEAKENPFGKRLEEI
jgi:NAD-dependent SIR2 family protein deacetylase